MSRKDYRLIASVLRGQRDEAARLGVGPAVAVTDSISLLMARALGAENGTFDRTRFLEACGMLRRV